MVWYRYFFNISLLIQLFFCFFKCATFSLQVQANNYASNILSYRELVAINNRRFIDDHNQKGHQFSLKDNQFIQMTTEEFAAMMTNKQPNSNINIQRLHSASTSSAQIIIGAIASPIIVNIDHVASGFVTPVKTQGQCNSCWAFTAIAAIESALLIKNKAMTYDLSEQQLIDCSATFGTYGCFGGFYNNGLNYNQIYGAATQSDYPYKGITGTCSSYKGKYFIKSYSTAKFGDCNALTSGLVSRPLAVTVSSGNPYWQYYSSGVMSMCSGNLDHGVLLVQIFQHTNGTNYYKLKNSWGTGWGQNGFIRLNRTVNNGNICLICSYPTSVFI